MDIIMYKVQSSLVYGFYFLFVELTYSKIDSLGV